jgi:hypothetical protein
MANEVTEFIEKVRKANPIEKVLAAFVSDFQGCRVEGTAKLKLKCLCPFHEGKDPKFIVYPREQFYRCFSCDRMGDVFDLVRELKKVDFPGALEVLAQRADIPRPALDQGDWQEELELRALGDILGAATDFYYQERMSLAYGAYPRSHKSPSNDSVIEAKVGWARRPGPEEVSPEALASMEPWLKRIFPDELWRNVELCSKELGPEDLAPEEPGLAEHLATRGFDLELAKKAGVLKRDGSECFHNTPVLPYFDQGRVVYMSGNFDWDSGVLRYQDLPMTELARRALWAGDERHRGKLIIVESFADALSLQKWGHNAVPMSETDLWEGQVGAPGIKGQVYVWFGDHTWDKAMALGQRIVRQGGVVPYVVGQFMGLRYGCEGGPRDCLLSDCEEPLQHARELFAIMEDRIQSCRGGDREKAVEELFSCICWLPESEIVGRSGGVSNALNMSLGEYTRYAKAARRREMRSQGGRIGQAASAGDKPPGSFLEMHPALDYVGEDGVVSVALEVGSGDRVLARAYLITSSHEKLALDGQQLHIKGKPVLFRSKPRAPDEERWSRADIERFLEGDDPQPSQTFARLLDIVRRHIDFKEAVHAQILTVWCMGSYLFPLFGAYPYLHLYGLKGTGKTQTMTLASKVAFNMVLATGITPASTFRLVQSLRCCLGLDEAEDLRLSRDHDGRGLLRFLRAGYKKGASVIKTEGDSAEGFRPRRYDVYSPKMIATMGPVEDILGSRCISINMLRTKDPQIGRVELSDESEDWAGMRHELYCFALNHFKEVRQIYHDEVESNMLLNRDHELWRPLFAVAKLLGQRGAAGVWERLVEYAVRVSQEDSSIALEDFDVVLIRALESLLGRDGSQGRWIYAEDIGRIIRRNMEGEYLPKQVTQKIGYSLRNLGLLASPRFRKRSASRVTYYIRPEDVRDIRERYGIESVRVEPPVAEPAAA